jgi:hypothetical protein
MFGLRNRVVAICCAGSAAAAVLAGADAVFSKVRAGIAADVSLVRGIACMESVDRTRYAPLRPNSNATCAELLPATTNAPRGAAQWHSRLRLDVTAGDAADEFSFTGASPAERTDAGGILRAALQNATGAGSGAFSSFLRDLMALDPMLFQSLGLQQTDLGPLVAFEFAAPAGFASGGSALAGYRGRLFAVPASGDLKRLTLEAENTVGACRVRYTTDFTPARAGYRELILPQSSTMDAVYPDGTELRSEAYYSGCRNPAADLTPARPVPSAPTAPKPMPPDVRLRARFQPAIDTETAATGDPVTAVIRTTVKDKQNGIVVHAGDRLHGRIAAIEEYLSPQPKWIVSVVFGTIERGVGENGIDQGVEQPVSLVPVDDGDRTARDAALASDELQKLRPPGGGYFVFHGPKATLSDTEWETR